VTGYRAVIYANASFDPTTRVPTSSANRTATIVVFGDANRHPWLEAAFNLTSRGCGLEKGAEAHCLLTVDSYVWGGVVVNAPAVVAVGNGTRGAVYVDPTPMPCKEPPRSVDL